MFLQLPEQIANVADNLSIVEVNQHDANLWAEDLTLVEGKQNNWGQYLIPLLKSTNVPANSG